MSLEAKRYPIAPAGIASAFEESELPETFCLAMVNRYINAAGGAEKRRGIIRYGGIVGGTSPVNVTGLHEFTSKIGVETLYASGEGKIYRYDNATTWTLVYTFTDLTATITSVQFDNFLIFSNGVDSPIYFDGERWLDLHSITEEGFTATGSSTEGFCDTEIVDWALETQVAPNDLLHNLTTGTYAFVTDVNTVSVQTTETGPSAKGDISYSAVSAASGNRYRVIDLVENNVVPTSGGDADNVILMTSATATGFAVWSSAGRVNDWSSIGARAGDWIYNTTRGGIGKVTGSSGKWLRHTTIAAQTSNDSATFYKPCIPFSNILHVHYGRLYMVDSRDQSKVRISADANCRDFSTDSGILAASSFSFGAQQPLADVLVAMASYQRFMVFAGKQYTLLFEGTNPIIDTSGAADWSIVGMFPQGVLTREGLLTVGNDAVIVTEDGIQSFSLSADSATLTRENLSEAIKTELREKLANTTNIFAFHYPRRSWICCKIGEEIYVYNYTPYFGRGKAEEGGFAGTNKSGSWCKFDGLFASQNVYFVRRAGDLYCAGTGGKVYKFDTEVYTDDGQVFGTEYQTGWLDLDGKPTQKHLHYVDLTFDGAATNYTLSIEGDYGAESNNLVVVDTSTGSGVIGDQVVGRSKIGLSRVVQKKIALNLRGQQVRVKFTTGDTKGPDILSRFNLYYTVHGLR